MTRLTRNARGTWLLEVSGVKDRDMLRQMTDTEIPIIMSILEQVEVHKLFIDLTAIQDFDSRGLQFLLRMRQKLVGRNIPVILRNPNAHLRQILRIMQFDQFFQIEYGDIRSWV